MESHPTGSDSHSIIPFPLAQQFFKAVLFRDPAAGLFLYLTAPSLYGTR